MSSSAETPNGRERAVFGVGVDGSQLVKGHEPPASRKRLINVVLTTRLEAYLEVWRAGLETSG